MADSAHAGAVVAAGGPAAWAALAGLTKSRPAVAQQPEKKSRTAVQRCMPRSQGVTPLPPSQQTAPIQAVQSTRPSPPLPPPAAPVVFTPPAEESVSWVFLYATPRVPRAAVAAPNAGVAPNPAAGAAPNALLPKADRVWPKAGAEVAPKAGADVAPQAGAEVAPKGEGEPKPLAAGCEAPKGAPKGDAAAGAAGAAPKPNPPVVAACIANRK